MNGQAPAGRPGQPLEFTVQWMPVDVRRYLLARLYRPRLLVLLGLLAGGCLAFLVLLAVRAGTGLAGIAPSIVVVLALPFILLAVVPLLVEHHVRRAFRRDDLGAPTDWLVGPAGLRLAKSETTTAIGWEEIDSAREWPRGFGLSWQGGMLLVPKRCLPDETTVERLRDWLRERLGARFRALV